MMEPCHNIQQLPPELRCMIWSKIGQTEGYRQLLRTNHLIRSDVLSLIPGIGLSCQCSPYEPCSCGKAIAVKRLTIVVEPDCSTESWLKFSVSVLHGHCQGSSWKVGSLDDMIAQPLRYFRPKEIFIDFQAPKKGYYQASFLILRAKLFDVCAALDLVQTQDAPSLYLHFSDPWVDSGSGSGPNKPFWENRPPAYNRDGKRMRRLRDPDLRPLIKHPNRIESRYAFLYFYEMILTPFCMHWAWRNAKVTFDREPRSKSTSFITATDRQHIVYHGVNALILTAWAYTEQLIQDGPIKESSGAPQYENHKDMCLKWAAEEIHHISWKKALECYLNFTIATSESFQRIMGIGMSQTANLPETIWWHLDNSPRDAFSEDHPGSAKGAGNRDFEVGTWRWNHDIIRRRYQEWAQLWDDWQCDLLDPHLSHSFYSLLDLHISMAYPPEGDSDFEIVLDDDEDEMIPYEVFRAHKLRYIWPTSWKWQRSLGWKLRPILESAIRFSMRIHNLA
ncbi:hypothetical protein V8C35DRAFT_331932, partial [Trichoderma chlorosporum]